MKNKKFNIILIALILIIISLFFYRKAQSAIPKYLKVTAEGKLINVVINHLFSGSKKLEKIKGSIYTDSNYRNCIDQKDGKVTCVSYCPGTSYEALQYCPPKDGYINANNEEGKNYKDIIVTNHQYFFDYAMRRIFGFAQYLESQVPTSNTSKFTSPRAIAFLNPDNVKKSDNAKWCNGVINIEKALLGYMKSKISNGDIRIDTNRPAIYFYVSRYVYPVDKSQKCISFGLPMDIIEPDIKAVSKYLPKDFDISNISYYFLDISEYPY